MRSFIVLLGCLILGCEAQEHGHEHGADGHHDAAHSGEAVELEALAVTRWTEQTELFAEFTPLVVGRESKFAAHVTRLRDNHAPREGRMVIRIEGPITQEVAADGPKRPGIYGPILVPTQPGSYRMVVEVSGPELTDTIEVGEVTVYATAAEVPTPEEAGGPEPVSFLKEQAWRIPFATAVVQAGDLPASVPAFGAIEAPSAEVARISAPLSGLLLPPEGGFPVAGQPIQKGQTLARLVSGPAEGLDVPALLGRAAQARIQRDAARLELERLTRLAEGQAASTREVEEATARVGVLEAELSAAEAGLASLRGEGGQGLSLTAPLTGHLSSSYAGSWRRVGAGEPLFEVVGATAVRLRADVAEVDLPRLVGVTDAAFTLPGERTPHLVSALGGSLLSVGRAVEPSSRTVPVWFEIPNSEGRLVPGTGVTVHLLCQVTATPPTGEGNPPAGFVVAPALAVVDDSGQAIVFVQVEGESFERREVTVGARAAGQVLLTSGVYPGERIVTQGAYEIRLSSLAGSGFGAGHAH